MERLAEICCGSYYDALQAAKGGAVRIELNSGLHLGGLTPAISALLLTKRETDLKVIAMARPRSAGFCYGPEDFKEMYFSCQIMMNHGADGVAFGCLKADGAVDPVQTKMMVEAVHDKGGEAVFHRAFDCVKDPYGTMEQLIGLGVDRVLTSGLKAKATEGWELIRDLNQRYGNQITILAGSGINSSNAAPLMDKTGISQVHSSCKDWIQDPTTSADGVSFGYAELPMDQSFDVVSSGLVRRLIDSLD